MISGLRDARQKGKETMRCPYCNAPVGDDEAYCANCGKMIPQPICANCGVPLARGAHFCPNCGAPQDDSSEQEPYYNEDDDLDWEDDEPERKWWPVIVIVIVAAAVVIALAAWRIGIVNRSSGREEAAVVEEEEELAESEHVYRLNFVTQTLEFTDPGLTEKIVFDTDIENQSEIKWSSSDTAVARVDENGYVTSVGSGRAVITAQWGDLSASCQVACDYSSATDAGTAGEKVPETENSYYLNFAASTMEFSEAGMTSRISFSTNIENQSEIKWSSSDLSVATVDQNGYVTSVGSGRAVITAQWENVTASCQVTCDFESAAEAAEGAAAEGAAEEGAVSTGDYLCSYSSSRLITQADMAALEASDYGSLPAGWSLAQMIIDEIYAKHGYLFQTPEIQAYFEQKDWYQNLGSFSSDQGEVLGRMNDIERQNITFLENY